MLPSSLKTVDINDAFILVVSVEQVYYINMPGTYRMVIVSGIACAVLVLGLFIYYYIYPKKKPNLLILLLLISILPLLSILRYGAYESGDFNLHIYRAMSFFDNLKNGVLFPSWAGD